MFTGLIETLGTVTRVEALPNGKTFTVACPALLDDLKPDDSVAVNGVCLTATTLTADGFMATAVGETLSKSTLGALTPGRMVNLERALKLGARLGGHLVQGHVDGVAQISYIANTGTGFWLDLDLPESLARYAIGKGSIAINGISLTLAEVHGHAVRVAVIPYTWTHTVLQHARVGDRVNIEMDVIGKYVEKLLGREGSQGLNLEKLQQLGF